MATALGRQLTEAHRLAQRRIGLDTIARVRNTFPLLDPEAIDATFGRWLATVEPIVQRQRQVSARVAAQYLIQYRAAEIGAEAAFTPTLAGALPTRLLRTSMLVTGPAQIRSKLSAGAPLVQVMSDAEASAAAAAMRHTVNAGRDTILDTVNNDRRAHGWQRVTSANPCSFCALLATRGAVYRSEGRGSFPSHDACLCAAQPVYNADEPPAPGVERFRQIYNESTVGLSGAEARNAFRQALAAAR
jgi:hypothetical protein